ncbi:MAG TPA: hypothetical protein VFM95_06185 [Microcella sp.]|nr:hypothetical protein [Microcella sp.]
MTHDIRTLEHYPNPQYGITIGSAIAQVGHPFVVEAVPGGFIVSGVGGRQVARNVAAVARLLREWAPKPEAKPE